MKFFLRSALLALTATQTLAAAQWGFTDATVTVSTKGAGVGSGNKQKLLMDKKLPEAVKLGAADTLKIILTTQEGKSAKKAHQAFLTLEDEKGLETSFAFAVKDTGKAKFDLTQKDIPPQLLQSDKPLSASVVIGSFGGSKPYNSAAFELSIHRGEGSPALSAVNATRYGKLPEIHHIFKPDPKSPPKIITLIFTAAVLGAFPVLFGTWLALGANFNHLGKAIGGSPVGHALYFGGILAMQGVFAAYYWSWNLFQMLPVAGIVGVVVLFAGSKALTEVQERRLNAQR